LNDRAADNWRPPLAIADLAGGDWPKRARDAACVISGEGHDSAIGVELLKDIRLAFSDEDAIRSKDLVAKLAEDPERPWAEWKHGRPLSPNQLGRLLAPFGIISETVHIPDLADAKGYQRVHFEPLWAVYCPVKTPSSGDSPVSKRPNVQMPGESAQVSDSQNVQKAISDVSENAKLSHSHAGLDAWTVENPESGGEGNSATTETPCYDPGPIPDCLRRVPSSGGNGHAVPNDYDAVLEELAVRESATDDYPELPDCLRRPAPPLCDNCGRPATSDQRWDWPGRPDGITLHSSCEVPWFDSARRH
jgi:hypothetical protein